MFIKCPSCKGEKVIYGHPVYDEGVPLTDRKFWVEFPCHFCGGDGIVSEEVEKWMVDGDTFKDRRIAKKLTLRKSTLSALRKKSCLSPDSENRDEFFSFSGKS